MRWIWIDGFTEFHSGKSARAVKNLSRAEDHFADHFPGWPVMPGTLMLEGMAQAGGILVGEANHFSEKVVLAKIPKAVFHREATAGEVLTYDVELLHLRPEGASVAGRAHVNGDPVAEAEIFFAHLDKARSGQLFGDRNFVFTGEMKYLLDRLKAPTASGGRGASAP